MKGFIPTGKGPKSGHSFPSQHGFSGSTGSVKSIGPYTRKAPKFAKGGHIDSALTKRVEPVTQFDKESGGKSPLRPGFKRGGLKKAIGGPVSMKKGGKQPGALQQASGAKSAKGFKRAPMFGGHKE